MKEAMETSDIVIGVLASLGIVVLIMVFGYVVKKTFFGRGDEQD